MTKKPFLLLLSVFIIATCGLIYELIGGTLASYLLGDSVTQFSTIIGVYLFSMGLGSWLSKYFDKNLLSWFIKIEIMVGLVGGTSSTILFIVFESDFFPGSIIRFDFGHRFARRPGDTAANADIKRPIRI